MEHPAGKLEPLVPKDASEHAHALFEKLFLASPDAIIVTTMDGHISAASPATERLFGYSQRELIGNLVEILIPERFRAAASSTSRRVCGCACCASNGNRPRTLLAPERRN